MDFYRPNPFLQKNPVLPPQREDDAHGEYLRKLQALKGFEQCTGNSYHGYTEDGKLVISLDFQPYIDANLPKWTKAYENQEHFEPPA